MRFFFLALSLLLVDLSHAGIIQPPTTWRVGNDPACHFATIDAAVGASIGGDSIRVSDGPTMTNVSVAITNKSLDISGGWEDCSATSRNTWSRTLIEGANDATPIRVSGNAGQTVSLTGLSILNSGGFVTGGALRVSGDVTVHLDDSTFVNNGAVLGGAIAVIDGATVNISRTTVGGANSAALGGGLFCQESTVNISDISIENNQASSQGGGIYSNDCFILTQAPINDFPIQLRLLANNADLGGGIFATGGSIIGLGASNTRELLISGNFASSGGGLYLDEASTVVKLSGAEIAGNTTSVEGSVAYLTNGAELDIDRGNADGSSCFDPIYCSMVANNSAPGHPAFVADMGAELDIRQTFLENNKRLIRVSDANTTLVLESVVVRGHETAVGNIIEVTDSASAQLRHVTSYDNDGADSLLFSNVAEGDMLLQNSLFWEAEPILSGPATAQCVNASDDTIPGAAMVDAGFVDGFDPMSIGLMLANDSPNVDACGESTIFPDILGQPRNVGFLSPITLSDRGAFELQDVLFSDNFD